LSGIKIKHIVFDLGGVIVNLDPDLTIQAFAKLSGKSMNEITEYYLHHELFHSYEKGLISNADFRNGVRDLMAVKVIDNTIDYAWNAMLLDTPAMRLDWMRTLKDNYQVSILSNTNDIHISQVHQQLELVHGLENFSTLVHQVYYSHQINLRKPNEDIYEYVLARSPFDAEETLFLDDNESNIVGAKSVGLQTMHVTDPNQIPTLLNNAGIQL